MADPVIVAVADPVIVAVHLNGNAPVIVVVPVRPPVDPADASDRSLRSITSTVSFPCPCTSNDHGLVRGQDHGHGL